MYIRVFAHTANPETDRPICHKSPKYVADLLARSRAIKLSDTSVQLLPAPEARRSVRGTLGWKPSSRGWQALAMKEGRKGQFSYPIPYVYEGHLTSPQSPTFAAR